MHEHIGRPIGRGDETEALVVEPHLDSAYRCRTTASTSSSSSRSNTPCRTGGSAHGCPRAIDHSGHRTALLVVPIRLELDGRSLDQALHILDRRPMHKGIAGVVVRRDEAETLLFEPHLHHTVLQARGGWGCRRCWGRLGRVACRLGRVARRPGRGRSGGARRYRAIDLLGDRFVLRVVPIRLIRDLGSLDQALTVHQIDSVDKEVVATSVG
mmetsp:Transcript_40571/g.103219  ORF Transcript_40571/g.103219 Transcript_40571/m.103219 type:complete len:212 (-) Transcript_40571:610-1245(-)